MTDTLPEIALLSAAVFHRDAWETVADYVDPHELTAHGGLLWNAISTYYRRDSSAAMVDLEILRSTLEREHPRHVDTFNRMLGELSPDIGGTNVAREVLALKRERAAEDLMGALAARRDPEDMAPLIAAYADLNAATGLLDAEVPEVFNVGLDALIQRTEAKGGRIKLYPKVLNKYLRGGVLPGHCVVIFGRVNVGKSALAIFNTAGFLFKGLRVLYVENEDLLDDTAIRVGCALTGWTRDQAAANPAEFKRLAEENGYGNLIIPDPAPDSPMGIEKLILAHKPDVVVVNQARNLTVGHKDSVAQMDAVAKALRQIGKKHRVLMILVTAAKEGEIDKNGEVREKWVMEMADCYSSRTGFPAAADVMIGYGTSASMNKRKQACLHLAKSKLSEFTGRTFYVDVDYSTGRFTTRPKEG